MQATVGMDQLRYEDVLAADWVTGVLLALLLAIVWVNLVSPGQWWSFVGGVLGFVPERQAARIDPGGQDRMFLIPVLLGLFSTALLLWQLDAHVRGEEHRSYLFWSGAVAAMIVVHLVATRMLAVVLRDGGLLAQNTRQGLRSFVMAGLLLLPLLMVVAYRPEWRTACLAVGCALLMMALIHRWVRTVRIGWTGGVPLRFIMIYLCAAEIVPVLLLMQALRPPVRALFNL